MSESSSGNSAVIWVALIGALGSVAAALIGLMPWLLSKPEPSPATANVAPTTAAKATPNLTGPGGVPPMEKKAKPVKPPVDVSFRRAAVPTRGVVIQLANTAAREPLEKVVVTIQRPGEKSDRVFRAEKPIRPNESISVGWLELGNFAPKKGDTVRVRAEGYPVDWEEVINVN
ncbi:hypothetical protein [Tuwongella immobilis]|uniref:Uncharacterized protein n=1 Tax=Tuwongella immobilis TaxID=692036 RepID=A0A6C2YJU0_9BACT|nr:hypothetical protein [Tuwongella immobilis]VIP01375.1 unnamed protein product [Tuwongella immobilis]VTR98218.1 unnamed protein product [Tuwongella immobilis]